MAISAISSPMQRMASSALLSMTALWMVSYALPLMFARLTLAFSCEARRVVCGGLASCNALFDGAHTPWRTRRPAGKGLDFRLQGLHILQPLPEVAEMPLAAPPLTT